MSAPFIRSWVAKLCLKVWGVTFFTIPAFRAHEETVFWIDTVERRFTFNISVADFGDLGIEMNSGAW